MHYGTNRNTIMTKQEFLQYKEEQRKQAAYERIKKLAGLGECKGLTDDEWGNIETPGKSRLEMQERFPSLESTDYGKFF